MPLPGVPGLGVAPAGTSDAPSDPRGLFGQPIRGQGHPRVLHDSLRVGPGSCRIHGPPVSRQAGSMEPAAHLTSTKRGSVAITEQAPPARHAASPAAHAVELRKTYGTGQATVHALAGIDVTFERGRFTAVMGPSGSGKSTLMHCMAGLDRPTSGQCYVGDIDIGVLGDKGLTQIRRDHIGFVFQSFNLVPTLTAGENITLPVDLA